MKSAHEICGCLDGVNCALTIDRDELLRGVNSAENRARLAEDREQLLRVALTRITEKEGRVCNEFEICEHHACSSSYTAWVIADAALKGHTPESLDAAALEQWHRERALDAQEPRT